MKPTIAQQQLLKKYLRKNLRYSETYAEFYDHILTALENISGIPFEDAVNQVIDNDFGGGDGMVDIEDRYRKQTIKEMQGRYLHYLGDCLRFPLVIFLAISAIMIYYLVTQRGFSFLRFFWPIIVLSLIPSVLNSIRYFRTGYIGGDTKRSVKDEGFKWLKYLPGAAGFLIIIFHSFYLGEPINWFKYTNPITLTLKPIASTLIIMAYTLHVITFYRVFRDEYKITMTA